MQIMEDNLAWQKLKKIVIQIEKDLPIAFKQSFQLSACLFIWRLSTFFNYFLLFLQLSMNVSWQSHVRMVRHVLIWKMDINACVNQDLQERTVNKVIHWWNKHKFVKFAHRYYYNETVALCILILCLRFNPEFEYQDNNFPDWFGFQTWTSA